ncbi:unnamed protein product [Cuscuta europaea]|uniref:Uncharacterized protein n=1 Tax=Cuscuta europaea TaxID=41803 RepID=A0A9P1EMU7_CUSEU|nr:unnamed protein product [Cuscuta europaea]
MAASTPLEKQGVPPAKRHNLNLQCPESRRPVSIKTPSETKQLVARRWLHQPPPESPKLPLVVNGQPPTGPPTGQSLFEPSHSTDATQENCAWELLESHH